MQFFLQFFAKVSFRAGDEGVKRLSPSQHGKRRMIFACKEQTSITQNEIS